MCSRKKESQGEHNHVNFYLIQNLFCSKQIKHAWDAKKSLQANLKEMGISADPNKTVKIPKTKVFDNSCTKCMYHTKY